MNFKRFGVIKHIYFIDRRTKVIRGYNLFSNIVKHCENPKAFRKLKMSTSAVTFVCYFISKGCDLRKDTIIISAGGDDGLDSEVVCG